MRPESIKATAVTGELLEPAIYWSDGSVDRYQFLMHILSKLDQGGWSTKTDSGWTSYDIEVFAHAWSRVRLLTVSEDLDQGKRTLRCRIQGSWSLSARLLFGSVTIAAILMVVGMATQWPWIWLSLGFIPLVLWIIEDERQDYTRALAVVVDEAATAQKLTRITPAKTARNAS